MTPQDIIECLESLRFQLNDASRNLKQATEDNEKIRREQTALKLSVLEDHEYLQSLKGLRGTHILRRRDGFEKILNLQLGFPPVVRHLPSVDAAKMFSSETDLAPVPLEFAFSRFLHMEGRKMAVYLEV